jgi:hypothetical protein
MIRCALLIAVLALAAGGCGNSSHVTGGAPRTITDLHDIDQLRAAFDTASDEPRLIVIVSPT